MRLAAGLLDAHDLVVHLRIPPREERAAVDHHVDLVRAEGDRVLHLAHLDVERALA